MNSTFSRAVIGFIVLTTVVVLMAATALWSVDAYARDYTWVSILVIIIALGTVIGIYSSTLHDPVRKWINEPERERQGRGK